MARPSPPSRSHSEKNMLSPSESAGEPQKPHRRDGFLRKYTKANMLSAGGSPRRSSHNDVESPKKSKRSMLYSLFHRRKHISSSASALDISVHRRPRHNLKLSAASEDHNDMIKSSSNEQSKLSSRTTPGSEASDFSADAVDFPSGHLTEPCSSSYSSGGTAVEQRMADRLATPRPLSAALPPPSTGCLKRDPRATHETAAQRPDGELQRISWGDIDVHSHGMTLGDNPSCNGPPMMLDWVSHESVSIGLDAYEDGRPERRSKAQLVMPRDRREDILRRAGFARSHLKEAVAIGAEIRASREKNSQSSTTFKGLVRWR